MNYLKTIPLFLFLIIIFPVAVSAQAPPPPPVKPEQTPVDGGLALLAAAGGAYAINKLRERKE